MGPKSLVRNIFNSFSQISVSPSLQFRALAPMYYRGSAAAIIVYDITKEVSLSICLRLFWKLSPGSFGLQSLSCFVFQETFSTLKNWVKELRQHGPPNIVVAIAGNKCDLIDVRCVRRPGDYSADYVFPFFLSNIQYKYLAFILSPTLKNSFSFSWSPEVSNKN